MTMLSTQALMEYHVEALFVHDAARRLRVVNEPGGAPAPRFFLGRTSAGNVWRFRSDLPDATVRQLEELCADEMHTGALQREPRHFEPYMVLLQAHAPIQSYWTGPAYRVPVETVSSTTPSRTVRITRENSARLRGGFEWLITEIDDAQPCLAILNAGQAVSICRTVRITPEAHEAGIETLGAFRGRGYAGEVVAGWAAAVHKMEAVPLYSTSWKNVASQRVAVKSAMALYGVTFHVT